MAVREAGSGAAGRRMEPRLARSGKGTSDDRTADENDEDEDEDDEDEDEDEDDANAKAELDAAVVPRRDFEASGGGAASKLTEHCRRPRSPPAGSLTPTVRIDSIESDGEWDGS